MFTKRHQRNSGDSLSVIQVQTVLLPELGLLIKTLLLVKSHEARGVELCFKQHSTNSLFYSFYRLVRGIGYSNPNTKFYQVQATAKEVHSGYLYKSPPPSVLSKSLKTWKRRFFVLSRTGSDTHELMYFKDEHKREKPIGEIDLYRISLLFLNPNTHPTWEWIQRNFRCSSSCVLYMRAVDRDYFLVGENSEEMDQWYNAIFKTLNTRSHSLPGQEENRVRSISEPLKVPSSDDMPDSSASKGQSQSKDDQAPPSQSARPPARSAPLPISMRHSAPESMEGHYDYPKSYRKAASIDYEKSEDEEEEDEVKISEESETEDDANYYMDMGKLKGALLETHTEKEDSLKTEQHTKLKASMDVDRKSDKNQGMKNPSKRSDGEHKGSENSFQSNRSSGSTGLVRQISQLREKHTPVEKEICVTQEELRNSVIFSEAAGKPCVSETRQIQSGLFHEGDRILAINDLLTDTLEEVQTYLRRINKEQVKVTILRQPGSRPLNGCSA